MIFVGDWLREDVGKRWVATPAQGDRLILSTYNRINLLLDDNVVCPQEKHDNITRFLYLLSRVHPASREYGCWLVCIFTLGLVHYWSWYQERGERSRFADIA